MLRSIQHSASNWARLESLPCKASKSQHLPRIPLLISSRRSQLLSVCAELHERNRNISTATRISWFPSRLATLDRAAGRSCSSTNLSLHPHQLLDMPVWWVAVAKEGGLLHSHRTCPRLPPLQMSLGQQFDFTVLQGDEPLNAGVTFSAACKLRFKGPRLCKSICSKKIF